MNEIESAFASTYIHECNEGIINSSGITPVGGRILIKPDKLEETTPGGIVIPDNEKDRHQMGVLTGTVIAVGPDSWTHTVKDRWIDDKWVPFERTRYSQPFAEVGERVMYARYCGQPTWGEDGEEYRLINDEDITATVSDSLDLTEFRLRERLK